MMSQWTITDEQPPLQHHRPVALDRPGKLVSSITGWRRIATTRDNLASLTHAALTLGQKLHDPLSYALLPLFDGLNRTLLLRCGVTMHTWRIHNISINVYYQPGQARQTLGMPILLLHGLSDNALTWFWQLLFLTSIGPVYALDLPGFGLSGYPPGRRYATLPDMCAVIETALRDYIWQPALIVGNSLGGWLAIKLAWQIPDLVRGIVLLNPGGPALNGRSSWQAFADALCEADLRTVRQIYRQLFALVPPPIYLGQRSFQARFRHSAVCQFIDSLAAEDFLYPEDVRYVPVPAGLIWGLNDTFLPDGVWEFYRDHLACTRMLVLRGCGHLPQRERPWRVIRFVRTMAQELG